MNDILFRKAFASVLIMLESDSDGALGLISPIRQCAFDAGIPNEQWPAFFAYCYRELGIED